MDALFGSAMPLAVRFFIAFLVVLALIGLAAWLVRRFGANRLGGASRGRQPRLAVIDAASVDGRRRLVLIRRDNIEHLLMIGGPTDVVIEPNIVRAAAAGAREMPRVAPEQAARVASALEPSWQPPVSEPAPVAPPRPYRAPATEEPWLPPEPATRARPADSLTGLAAELSSKLSAPADLAPPPARGEQVPRTTVAPPMAPSEPPAAPSQSDHNLAEMAQQLEAALRRAPAPEGRPSVTDALAVPPPAKAQPRPATYDVKSRVEPKFESPMREPPKFEPPKYEPPKVESRPEPKFGPKFEPKSESKSKPEAPAAPEKKLYDNLEEEMASLLGRPPDKP
jgi:flagellar protein FliO/FliZ